MARSGWPSFARYAVLVGVLTVPFWLAGYLIEASVMPGLSVSAFAIVVPSIAAAILVAREGGLRAIGTLLGSLRRPGRHVLALGGLAIAVPLAAGLLSWLLAAPAAQAITIPPAALLGMVPIFIVAAIAEEIGWSAFATERLAGAGIVVAGLAIGGLWAVWHYPSLLELGRSPEWIAWWTLWTFGQRAIMVLLYIRAGGWVWAPVLYHAASNVAWQLAPEAFDPMIEGLATAALAVLLLTWLGRRADRAGNNL